MGTIFEPSINSRLEAMNDSAESYLNPTASVSNVTPESSGSKQVELVDECVRISGSSSPASAAVSEQQLTGRKESSSPQDLDNYVDVGLVGENRSTYIPSESQQHQDHPPPTLPIIPDQEYDPQTVYGSHFRSTADETARVQSLQFPRGVEQDDFYPSFPVGFLQKMGLDFIKCPSKEDALRRHRSLSSMPMDHFIVSSCACNVDGVPGISVQKHQRIISYNARHRQRALRHLINTPVQLELAGILNADLTDFVDVGGLPKFLSIPAQYDGYDTLRKNMEKQRQQICHAADQIVGVDGIKSKEYQIFRKRLLNCETIVDWCSMLCHPVVHPNRSRPFLFNSNRLARHYYPLYNPTDFSSIIKDFSNEDFSHPSKGKRSVGSRSQQKVWLNVLRDSGNNNLKKMLTTRIDNHQKPIKYNSSESSNHTYIRNTLVHVNDGKFIYHSAEDIHKDLEEAFPLYSLEDWEFMHDKSLNAQFGAEEYSYFFLDCVKEITRSKDSKRFYFAPLLKACQMCMSMTAKFQNSYERSFLVPRFKSEVTAAASELDYCIKGLVDSNEEYHQFVSLATKKDQMTGLDKLVFKSVRIILFALHFISALRNQSVSRSIVTALTKTSELIQFSSPGTSGTSRKLDAAALLWPGTNDVWKITGLHFLSGKEAEKSFLHEIVLETWKLKEMIED